MSSHAMARPSSKPTSDPLPGVHDPDERAAVAAIVWRLRQHYRPKDASNSGDDAYVRWCEVLDIQASIEPLMETLGGGWRAPMPMGFKSVTGQWWPAPYEVAPCCYPLKTFGANFLAANKWAAWANMQHCRSLRHVALRFGVPQAAIRRAWGRLRAFSTLSERR